MAFLSEGLVTPAIARILTWVQRTGRALHQTVFDSKAPGRFMKEKAARRCYCAGLPLSGTYHRRCGGIRRGGRRRVSDPGPVPTEKLKWGQDTPLRSLHARRVVSRSQPSPVHHGNTDVLNGSSTVGCRWIDAAQRLRGDAVVTVVQTADFWNGDDLTGGRRCDRARVRRVLGKRKMGSRAHVEVDNATPIVLSLEKFVIRGIRGAVGLWRCTRRWPKADSRSDGAGSTTSAMIDRSKCRPGCLNRPCAITCVWRRRHAWMARPWSHWQPCCRRHDVPTC